MKTCRLSDYPSLIHLNPNTILPLPLHSLICNTKSFESKGIQAEQYASDLQYLPCLLIVALPEKFHLDPISSSTLVKRGEAGDFKFVLPFPSFKEDGNEVSLVDFSALCMELRIHWRVREIRHEIQHRDHENVPSSNRTRLVIAIVDLAFPSCRTYADNASKSVGPFFSLLNSYPAIYVQEWHPALREIIKWGDLVSRQLSNHANLRSVMGLKRDNTASILPFILSHEPLGSDLTGPGMGMKHNLIECIPEESKSPQKGYFSPDLFTFTSGDLQPTDARRMITGGVITMESSVSPSTSSLTSGNIHESSTHFNSFGRIFLQLCQIYKKRFSQYDPESVLDRRPLVIVFSDTTHEINVAKMLELEGFKNPQHPMAIYSAKSDIMAGRPDVQIGSSKQQAEMNIWLIDSMSLDEIDPAYIAGLRTQFILMGCVVDRIEKYNNILAVGTRIHYLIHSVFADEFSYDEDHTEVLQTYRQPISIWILCYSQNNKNSTYNIWQNLSILIGFSTDTWLPYTMKTIYLDKPTSKSIDFSVVNNKVYDSVLPCSSVSRASRLQKLSDWCLHVGFNHFLETMCIPWTSRDPINKYEDPLTWTLEGHAVFPSENKIRSVSPSSSVSTSESESTTSSLESSPSINRKRPATDLQDTIRAQAERIKELEARYEAMMNQRKDTSMMNSFSSSSENPSQESTKRPRLSPVSQGTSDVPCEDEEDLSEDESPLSDAQDKEAQDEEEEEVGSDDETKDDPYQIDQAPQSESEADELNLKREEMEDEEITPITPPGPTQFPTHTSFAYQSDQEEEEEIQEITNISEPIVPQTPTPTPFIILTHDPKEASPAISEISVETTTTTVTETSLSSSIVHAVEGIEMQPSNCPSSSSSAESNSVSSTYNLATHVDEWSITPVPAPMKSLAHQSWYSTCLTLLKTRETFSPSPIQDESSFWSIVSLLFNLLNENALTWKSNVQCEELLTQTTQPSSSQCGICQVSIPELTQSQWYDNTSIGSTILFGACGCAFHTACLKTHPLLVQLADMDSSHPNDVELYLNDRTDVTLLNKWSFTGMKSGGLSPLCGKYFHSSELVFQSFESITKEIRQVRTLLTTQKQDPSFIHSLSSHYFNFQDEIHPIVPVVHKWNAFMELSQSILQQDPMASFLIVTARDSRVSQPFFFQSMFQDSHTKELSSRCHFYSHGSVIDTDTFPQSSPMYIILWDPSQFSQPFLSMFTTLPQKPAGIYQLYTPFTYEERMVYLQSKIWKWRWNVSDLNISFDSQTLEDIPEELESESLSLSLQWTPSLVHYLLSC